MTVDEVRAAVAKIAAEVLDDETAHRDEDRLHREVLAAIADGRGDDAASLAREALRTRDLDFSRWYA